MTNERKIKGYNLNELGERNRDVIEILLYKNDVTECYWDKWKKEYGWHFETNSMISKILEKELLLNLWFTPVFEEQYKEGEWLYGEAGGLSWVFRLNQYDKELCKVDIQVFNDGDVYTSGYTRTKHIKGPATEEQLLSHLSAAAVKKYEGATRLKNVSANCDVMLYEKPTFAITGNLFRMCGGAIFDLNTLQWAEIIEQPKEVEQPKDIILEHFDQTSSFKLQQQEFENSEKEMKRLPIINDSVQLAYAESADFEENTWTFYNPTGFVVSAGIYALINTKGITSITLSNGKVITAAELSRI